MTILFFDTETTGIPDFEKPSDGPGQPHIMQLTALLAADDLTKLSSLDTLISPTPEWVLDPKAFEAHGITLDRCTEGGVPIGAALAQFWGMVDLAGFVVGHNVTFDKRMVRIELKRLSHDERDGDLWRAIMERWQETPHWCSCKGTERIMNLPPTDKMRAAGFDKPKAPTLEEAYKFFTGKDHPKSHNAMYDLMACRAIFAKVRERGIEIKPVQPRPKPAREEAAAPISTVAEALEGGAGAAHGDIL